MNKNIVVIRGDGIGPEIVDQALKVLDKTAELYGHTFTYTDADMGRCAIDKYGDPLPESELQKCVVPDIAAAFAHLCRQATKLLLRQAMTRETHILNVSTR